MTARAQCAALFPPGGPGGALGAGLALECDEVTSDPMTEWLKLTVARLLVAWERRESGVAYDLLSPQLRQDPYPIYRELRSKDPVHRMRLVKAWALTRYEDVEKVLRDDKRFCNGDRILVKTIPLSLLDMDPPEHTRVRALVSKAFTPRAVGRLEGRIREITDRLLDAVAGRRQFDVIAALGYPLPITVIAEMLGVRAEDMGAFEGWSNTLALAVDPILGGKQVAAIKRAAEQVYAYFEGVIAERRREPRDDLVTALMMAEETGERLTHEEMLSVMLLILVAGNETTRNLIGNAVLALLRNPAQLERLREDRGLLGPAVDEFLRYDSPVQVDGRAAREDVEIGGKQIRAGDVVISVLGAANRDPEAFDDPESLDVGRRGNSHLSFGRGVHYCLGGPLAIMEARVALAGLLDRYSSLRLVVEPEYREGVALRGVERLWIEVEN